MRARPITGCLVALSLFALPASAQDGRRSGTPPQPTLQDSDDRRPSVGDVSPVLNIRRGEDPRRRDPPREPAPLEVRSIDGSGNNLQDLTMGSVGVQLLRMAPAVYADGASTLAGEDRPSPRAISNAVCAQSESVPNAIGASDYLWQWGQFVDHDLDLTEGTDPPEPAGIEVPAGDAWFDPFSTGEEVIDLNRSIHDPATGLSVNLPRQQLNEITAWIDASNVYGSDEERAAALRTLDGTGRLAMGEGRMPPFNTAGLPNAGGDSDSLYLCGDVRANEQVGLLALHALFVREHDRLAEQIRDREPGLTGDEVYERARRMVGAQMQVITYREYLPLLLGRDALAPYRGYRAGVDASIRNEFSTAAYRYGHSALNTTLLRLDAEGEEIAEGHLALRDAFFRPDRLTTEGGLDPVLRGLAAQSAQNVDALVIDDVRNFLFGPPGAGGFDLASLNIQRGREHGLPSYNDLRRALGLRAKRSFGEISSDPNIVAGLASVHDDVEQVDAWLGGLAEDHVPGALVGELIHAVLKEQFEALRDGDRHWYELTLSRSEIDEVERTRLSDIIRRNTDIGSELADDVFRVTGGGRGGGGGGGQGGGQGGGR